MPTGRIPLGVKLAYSAFLAVMVPSYWVTWGWPNFLFFCDVAAFVTGAGLWLESPLLLGTQAVAILVPQSAWVVDFVGRLLGVRLLGMTDYMFDARGPRWVRGLSLFHGWLPILLLWAVRRVGYDRRSFPVQVVAGIALLLACYLLFVPPGTTGSRRPAVNVNYVFGPQERKAQQSVPPLAWLAIVMAVAVFGMFVPAHLALRRTIPTPRRAK